MSDGIVTERSTATIREQLAGIIDPNTYWQREHVKNGRSLYATEWDAALSKADAIIVFQSQRKPSDAMLGAMGAVFFEWLGRVPGSAMLEEAYVAAVDEARFERTSS